MFVSAAKQVGFIEFVGDMNEGNLKFRWTLKNELTTDEKSQLYKKIIEMIEDELNFHPSE